MTGKAGAALPRIALIGFGAIADDVVRCLEVRSEIASLEGAIALAGRHIEAHGAVPVAYKSLVDAKKLRILAVGADARLPLYGDAPTVRENGVDLTIGAFHGGFAPNGTLTAIVDKSCRRAAGRARQSRIGRTDERRRRRDRSPVLDPTVSMFPASTECDRSSGPRPSCVGIEPASPILANGNPVPSEVGSNSMRICGRWFRFSVRTGRRFDCFVPIKAVSRLSLCARQKASLLELFTSKDIQ